MTLSAKPYLREISIRPDAESDLSIYPQRRLQQLLADDEESE